MKGKAAMPAPDSTLAMFSLAGRTAVVTGAGGLLGRQHCRALAEAGALVVATDIDAAACERTVASLRADLGGTPAGPIHGVAADITDRGSLEKLRAEVLRLGDRLDVLVNNAAINDKFDEGASRRVDRSSRITRSRPFGRALDVNVTGMFLACQVLGARDGAAPAREHRQHRLDLRPGRVPTSASTRPDGSQGFYKGPVYPTSKGAVLAFTRFLATDWGRRGRPREQPVARRRRGGAGAVFRREVRPTNAARPHGRGARAARRDRCTWPATRRAT